MKHLLNHIKHKNLSVVTPRGFPREEIFNPAQKANSNLKKKKKKKKKGWVKCFCFRKEKRPEKRCFSFIRMKYDPDVAQKSLQINYLPHVYTTLRYILEAGRHGLPNVDASALIVQLLFAVTYLHDCFCGVTNKARCKRKKN